MWLSEKDLGQSVEAHLILSIENGDGLRNGLEGTKCFGIPFRETNYECGMLKNPINPARLPN